MCLKFGNSGEKAIDKVNECRKERIFNSIFYRSPQKYYQFSQYGSGLKTRTALD
jgi:hypothetical protein